MRAAHIDPPPSPTPPLSPAIETRRTRRRGLELLACTPERATRPALLFVHGAFAGAWCWAEHFMPWFAARGYPTFAVSLRGHGDSPGREGLTCHSLHDYLDDLDDAATTLDRPYIALGHSMGGFLVQKHAERLDARQRARLQGLALMASVPPQGVAPAAGWMVMTRPDVYARLMMLNLSGPGSASWLLDAAKARDMLFAQPPPTDDLARHLARFQGESARVGLEMNGWNAVWAWRVPRVPLLILGGRQDALVAPALLHMTGVTYGRPAQIIDRMGHLMMLEQTWERAAEAIDGWAQDARRA